MSDIAHFFLFLFPIMALAVLVSHGVAHSLDRVSEWVATPIIAISATLTVAIIIWYIKFYSENFTW